MKFSPSLQAVYHRSGLSMEEQIRQVRSLGFAYFEFWSWWDKDLEAIRQAGEQSGLQVASICASKTNMVDANEHANCLNSIRSSIEAAARLGCRHIIGLTGNTLDRLPRQEQMHNIIQVLKACAPLLEEAEVTLILEPLNTRVNHPGYFLERSDEAFHIIDRVDSPNVKVLFDVYHQQISEGNLTPNIVNNIEKIGYFHIADHPGRHEPGTGEINYHHVLQAIKNTGYAGYVGLEYKAAGDAAESLKQTRENYKKYFE